MKSRMTSEDVYAMVQSLQSSVVNYRLSNVYDLEGKTYMFKFSIPDHPKIYFVVESGIRFHTTQYTRDKPSVPSQFTMKLRKHLRTKRLTSVTQLGQGDRVVDFFFGEGEVYGFHVILELYASGNIILTDYNYNILSLLRTHRYDEEVKVAVKQLYPIAQATESSITSMNTGEALLEWMKTQIESLDIENQQVEALNNAKTSGAKNNNHGGSKANKTKKKKKLNLKQILLSPGSGYEHYGPNLMEHCLLNAELKSSMKMTAESFAAHFSLDIANRLIQKLQEAPEIWKQLEQNKEEHKHQPGFIIVKILPDAIPLDEGSASEESATVLDDTLVTGDRVHVIVPTDTETQSVVYATKDILYEEFVPVLFSQHQAQARLEFKTFDQAMDEFFSKIELQQEDKKKEVVKGKAQKKFDRLQLDQEVRVSALRNEAEESRAKAQLIELNAEDIDKVILVLNSAIASGMDWTELEALVKFEQKNNNPVANLIYELQCEKNSVSVMMEKSHADENEIDEGDTKVVLVDIALHQSAMANARDYYTTKKKSSVKVEKTLEATTKALAVAEKNASRVRESTDQVEKIHIRRKIQWWEKFHWFISSENYLVLAGHDAQQNEMLVKRYLRKGDVYVHADIHGAASCIIRNNDPSKIIPQLTIEQAGTMCVCRSAAWSSQTITSAYWVHPHQVSKTAPTGEYLVTGSFMIRGKKNVVSPARLEMGLGVLFHVDTACVARHVGERVPRGGNMSDLAPEILAGRGFSPDVAPEDITSASQHLRQFERQKIRKSELELQEAVDAAAEALKGSSVMEEEEEEEEAYVDDDAPEALEKTKLSSSSNTGTTKKRITARERRLLKKQRDLGEDLNLEEAQASESQRVVSTPFEDGVKGKAAEVVEKPLTRGARRKAKKMKKKYKDQDDDERLLRMNALGNPMDEEEDKEQEEKKEKESVKETQEETLPKTKLRKPKTKLDAEVQQIMQEENIPILPEEQNLEYLDSFTGQPHEDDVFKCALVQCAPYSALTNYKYRVKLLPGTQKKGKATKQIMSLLIADSNSGVEKQFLRSITDNELVAACLAGVKVSAPGFLAHKSGARQSKKAKGRNKKK